VVRGPARGPRSGGWQRWPAAARPILAGPPRCSHRSAKPWSTSARSAPGQQAKLINNFLALGGLALVAEAHAVALRLGLDPARLCEAVSLGGGNSRVFQAMVPWITERDERRAQATLGTALKDVSYYAQLAGESGGPDQLARQVREQFAGAVEGGFGERFICRICSISWPPGCARP
jgi:3-hydroxyisobutyrate dehydrogenase-like beta-hydroxyacid dehydrogenase